jgi:hypothetical protein
MFTFTELPKAQAVLARYCAYQVKLSADQIAQLKSDRLNFDTTAMANFNAAFKQSRKKRTPLIDLALTKRAITYRRTAHALGLYAQTGIEVCSCHFKPKAIACQRFANTK